MLRPLLVNQSVSLVFDEPDDLPFIYSDESKISQILRNFISNALKYTERGEVRVSARQAPQGDAVQFSVADTGIGIPESDLARVFDEFVQIENPLQRRVKGTGLGLPLSKRLAELVGGKIDVTSQLGVGSTFSLTVPFAYRTKTLATVPPIEAGRRPVLVIEDAEEDLLVYERALAGSRFQVVPVRSAETAESTLDSLRPAAIILDLRLQGDESWSLLTRLKRDQRTASVPLVVVSTVDDRQKGLLLGADAYSVKPIDTQWLLETLGRLVPGAAPLRVVTVDDEEAHRFIVRELLTGTGYQVAEAATGLEGLRLIQELPPDVVLLDVRLTDMDGIEMAERLHDDAKTSRVPVILVTSHTLSPDERRRFGEQHEVLSKYALTRDALQGAIERAVGAARSPEIRV
jgi:CheY-like chemotaxis protein/anti-sigma regulatory factor (Ser/Thr protein kinase)